VRVLACIPQDISTAEPTGSRDRSGLFAAEHAEHAEKYILPQMERQMNTDVAIHCYLAAPPFPVRASFMPLARIKAPIVFDGFFLFVQVSIIPFVYTTDNQGGRLNRWPPPCHRTWKVGFR